MFLPLSAVLNLGFVFPLLPFSPPPDFPPFPPFPPLPSNLLIWLIPCIAKAPPSEDPPATVDAFSNPKNLRNIFSACKINPNAAKANTMLSAIKSIEAPIKTVYKIKCTGCISKLNIYSLSHVLNP